MAGKQVQRRRGTTAQHATFIGAAGEVSVDTNKYVEVVHDGATPGGFPMASARDIAATNATVVTAQNTANTALSTANTAKTTADTALSTANSANANKANINGGNIWSGNQNWSPIAGAVRMYGDFTAQPRAGRTLFQSSYGGNSESSVGVIPGIGGGRACFTAYSSTNPDDTYAVDLAASSNGLVTLDTYGRGSASGIYVPFKLNQSGRTGFQLLADGSTYVTNTVAGGARGRLVLSGADGSLPRYLQIDANGTLQFLSTAGNLLMQSLNDGSLTLLANLNTTNVSASGAVSGGSVTSSTTIYAAGMISNSADIYTNGYFRAATATTGGEAQLYRVRDAAQASTYIRETEVGNTLVITYLIASGVRSVAPASDGNMSSGWALARWSQVFAVAGAINTSDAREKTAVRAFSAEEMAVAQALAGDIGMYQWLSAVEDKGEDGARLHVGVTAQQVQARFEEQGLDASVYGLFCFDEWEAMPEVLGPDGEIVNEAKEAGNRYGVRYDELNQFILRGLLENQRSIEARLAALEAV